jgi:hypothetical protein
VTNLLDDEFWDDAFHGCAWAAYVELASVCRGQPDMEATRRLTYKYYEEALADRSRYRVEAPDAEELTADVHRAKVAS